MQNIDAVKVRMYRHGFGDCFLIRYYTNGEVTFKMLIDCGLKHNDSVAGVSIQDVVDDIAGEVAVDKGGEQVPQLDVLVITHEHWDHVSAFKPERALFDHFDIDNIWMAWTENPKDDVAQQINAHLLENIAALKVASTKLAALREEKKNNGFFNTSFGGAQLLKVREDYDRTLNSLLEFHGPLAATIETPSGIEIKDNFKISVETQKAFDHIKNTLAKNKSAIKYYEPGKIIERKDLPGIRIYVLGPPKSAQLNQDAPSKGAGKEVYFSLSDTNTAGFVKGVLKMAGVSQGFDDGSPFGNAQGIPVDSAKHMSFFSNGYYHPDESWRNIDEDWLDVAGALALQMDNDTNNTSLALAIELVDSGKILLFPGDAQVGNWLSWHDHVWKVKEGTKTKDVTAIDILGKTVFYKAGHHASHNATLKELGLEMMVDDNLVIFIPEKEKQYNGIPYNHLVDRMYEQAKGRVLFSADSNFPPQDTLDNKPSGISKKEWDMFKNNITLTDTFIEYTIDNV